MSDQKIYMPELDGLRFIAFLLVFFHHAPVLSTSLFFVKLNSYGWMGVDLFLCLSAFLFTRLLYTEYQRTGAINIPYFYTRRALRIWPLYYVFTSAAILYTFYNADPSGLPLRTIGILAFFDNILAASPLSYNPFYFAAHLWTIAYEEQFYAIIPWALRYLFGIDIRKKILILFSVLMVGYIIRGIFIWEKVPHPAIWVLPITHFDSIFFGLLIGLGMLDFILNKLPWLITGLLGLCSLLLACSLPNVQVIGWHLMFTYPLVGLGMCLILHTVLRSKATSALHWLAYPPLAFLGKISYGLYIYHLVGLYYIGGLLLKTETTHHMVWLFSVFIAPLAFTIIISTISYYLLEKPFLRIKDRFSIVLSRPA